MEISEHSIKKNKVPEHCIFRVPSRIRAVKPEAYTPQIVLIGPLHRSLKALDAKDVAETSSSNPWDLKKEYLKMEDLKKTYLESYTKRVGEDTIEEMRKTIQAEETNIRASYEESTEWIPSEYFVDLILHDSVFIMEFLIRALRLRDDEFSKEVNLDQPLYASMVKDLILLENQLPYFIFDSLFSSSMIELDYIHCPLENLIMRFFSLSKISQTNFRHFTDMFRYVYEESLDFISKMVKQNCYGWPPIRELRNADYLLQAGVDFKSSYRWDFRESMEDPLKKRKKERRQLWCSADRPRNLCRADRPRNLCRADRNFHRDRISVSHQSITQHSLPVISPVINSAAISGKKVFIFRKVFVRLCGLRRLRNCKKLNWVIQDLVELMILIDCSIVVQMS